MPPLHSEIVTATLDGRRPARGAARPRAGAAGPRRALHARPVGARRHGRVGAAVLRRSASPQQAKAHLPFDRRAGKSVLLPSRRFPSDPHDDAPRAERRRGAAAQRQPRAHRRRAQGALRRPRRSSRVTSIRRGFAGGGFDGQAEPAEEDGDGRRRPRRRPDPRHVGALPRLHVDAEGRARAAADREPRDARLRRPARRLLPRRHAHAPLAHHRGPRGVVPQLRLRRARAHGVPPGPDEREAGSADGAAGAEGRRRRGAELDDGSSSRPAASATAPRSRRRRGCCRTSSAPTAPSTRRARRSRSAPTSTRSTTRSLLAPTRSATS